MNMLFSVSWTSLIVFFVLGLIGVWVSYSFLNKNGFYLFCILASVVCALLPNAQLFSQRISISTVLMPIVFLTIIACFNKFGKQEAVRLFLITIITQIIIFIVTLLQSAYLDAFLQNRLFMSWEALGGYFANILAFAFACFGTMIFEEKVNLKKIKAPFKTACLVAVACAIENLIFVVVGYAGIISFGNMALTWLVKLFVSVIIAVCLGLFEKLLNRQLAFKIVKAEKTEDEAESKKETEKKLNSEQTKENKVEDKEKTENKQEKTKEETEESAENINYDNTAD